MPYANIGRVFTTYDPAMIVEFLISMRLCERITTEMMKSTNLTATMDDGKERLFFPALMTYEQRPTIKQLFQFGWCLQCTDQHQFFSPRFLHLLILRLGYKYAFLKEQDDPHQLRCCTIWSTGIMWSSINGVTTLVELVENRQCVLLLMYSHKNFENNMVPVRRAVVTDILSIQQKHCSSLRPKEFIIDPSELHYPIDQPSTLTRYDINMVATVVHNKHPVILPYENKSHSGITLADLLPMEHDRGQDISVFLDRDLEVSINV